MDILDKDIEILVITIKNGIGNSLDTNMEREKPAPAPIQQSPEYNPLKHYKYFKVNNTTTQENSIILRMRF